MLRYDRTRFAVFSLPALFNLIALLIYGLMVATSGTEDEKIMLIAVVLAILSSLTMIPAFIKRGRDLNWGVGKSTGIALGGILFGPAILIVITYMLFAKSHASAGRFGNRSETSMLFWFNLVPLLAWPWMIVVIANSFM